MKNKNNLLQSLQEKYSFLKHMYHKIFQVLIRLSVGLIRRTPQTQILPVTRRFWKRPSSSIERNGYFNIHTHNLNTRLIWPIFFTFLFYGWYGHPTSGWYNAYYNDNNEIPGNLYDKLNMRVPP